VTAATLARPPAEQILAALPHLTDAERIELDQLLLAGMPVWVPQEGPQAEAAASLADIVFYGGQAGGGKTDLIIGLSLTQHQRSQIFRREGTQLVGIEERMLDEILGSRAGYNGQDGILRWNGKVIELCAVKDEASKKKYQGRPSDLKAFDEITHFTESQFRFLIGWLRSNDPTQRCRVVCAGNPPTDADGEWVIRFWAPWLDPTHPNPAKSGELRWFIVDADGNDIEVPGPEPVMVKGKPVKPKSRTFIRSTLEDNLFYALGDYRATLASLPEPLRSQMAEGNFNAGRTDNVWQLIPTEWIKAAMGRWVDREAQGMAKGPMTAAGFDPSRGGMDKGSLARRHGTWFDKIVTAPGVVMNDGPKAAGFVAPLVRDGAPISMDGIGIGTAAYDFMRGLGLRAVSVIGSEGSSGRDKTGTLRFKNKRAEMHWRTREALDPTNPEPIALPPDQELLSDLCAVRYKVVQMGQDLAGIQVRDKDEIREVLGRSPDKGDSVVLTFIDGLPAAAIREDAARFREKRGLDR
jgi:hypothetical protein